MLVSKFEIREIKTTAKGPNQENREILTPRNKSLLQYYEVIIYLSKKSWSSRE